MKIRLSWGSGSKEIAARIGDELFDYLDGPVARRVVDTFVGYHPGLEDAILPQVRDVLAGIEKLQLLILPGQKLLLKSL